MRPDVPQRQPCHFLQRAGHVLIVEVTDNDHLAAAQEHVAGAARWLAGTGVVARALAVRSLGNDAEQLGTMAYAHGVDLVVAGAYGHGRLREWIIGGVTRALLLQEERCAFLSR